MQTIIHGPWHNDFSDVAGPIPIGMIMTLEKAKRDENGDWMDLRVRVSNVEMTVGEGATRQDVQVEELTPTI